MTPEELKAAIEENSSKANMDVLVHEVLKYGLDWPGFFHVFKSTKLPLKWRLSWWLGNYVLEHRSLANSMQTEIWNHLSTENHEGIQRDLWRIMAMVELNEELMGIVYDKAIKLIPSPVYPVAIRAYAMETAKNIALRIPALTHEVIMVLEAMPEEDKGGIISKRKNCLKTLKKITL